MRSMKQTFSVAVLLALAACAGGPLPEPRIETRYEEVPTIVSTGCVTEGGRPEAVTPLNERIGSDDWYARPVGARASAIEAQAGRRMNHAEQLDAATSGCR